MPAFPDDKACAVFDSITSSVPALAASCLAEPKEFWTVASTLCPALVGLNETTPSYEALVIAFVSLGETIVSFDAEEARNLFGDYALPKLVEVLRRRPTKRHATLRILYAFCAEDIQMHVQVIKVLQDRVGDMPVFLHCLAILVFLEAEFNADLVDLYSYYAMIGLSVASPGLRAACIGILSLLATCYLPQVLSVLSQIEAMKTDGWWEVQSQLLIFAGALLGQLHPSDPNHVESVQTVHAIIDAVFTTEATLRVRQIGLVHLGGRLRAHPRIMPRYLDVLLSLPPANRDALLGLDTSPRAGALLSLPCSTGVAFMLEPVAATWDSLGVAHALASSWSENDALERLELVHVQCLRAATGGNAGVESMQQAPDEWARVFQAASDYLFVALCDRECCLSAIEVIRSFATSSLLGDEVVRSPMLLASLGLLFPEDGGDEDVWCQENVTRFLAELSNCGPRLGEALQDVRSRW